MDVSNVIKQGLILQEENDRCNSLGLCRYYSKPRHIAIDYRNLTVLAIKKQAKSAFTGNLMVLVPYKPLSMEEKETSLG